MQTKHFLKIALILFIFTSVLLANINKSIQYVYPKPGSKMVSNKTNIILRNVTDINESTIKHNLISVVGSESGIHTGDFVLSDDNKTIVFNPHTAFAHDEDVNCHYSQV
jgi:hypothetical protein